MTPNPLDDELLKRPPPERHLDRIEFFARVLAHGAVNNYWSPKWERNEIVNTDPLRTYLRERWKVKQPELDFLEAFEYIQCLPYKSPSGGQFYMLTPKAFALLDKPLDRRVFISYKRSESSAFALLLHDRLQAEGFDTFIDLQNIDAGEKWLERIRTEISEIADIFISLIGRKTLKSGNVRQEIRWALERDDDLRKIAIWHNGYKYNSKTDAEFESFLSERNALAVKKENVLDYENEIARLIQQLKPRT